MQSIHSLIVLSGLFIYSTTNGQNRIDSLRTEYTQASSDTARILLLDQLAFEFRHISADSTLRLAIRALDFAKNINYRKGISRSLYAVAVGYHIRGEFDTALYLYDQAMPIAREAADIKGQSRILNNIGLIHWSTGNYLKALDQFQESVLLDEQTQDSSGLVSGLNNIGLIYSNMGDHRTALRYFERSLPILINLNDQFRLAQLYNNMGMAQAELKDYTSANENYRRSLYFSLSSGIPCHQAYPLVGIGKMMFELNVIDSAIHYGSRVIDMGYGCTDPKILVSAYLLVGMGHRLSSERAEAKKWLTIAFRESGKYGFHESLKAASQQLYEIYKSEGLYKKALQFHEVFQVTSDSLLNEENSRELGRAETRFETEREKRELLVQKERDELLLREEIQRHQLMRDAGIIGCILVMLLAFSYYRSFVKKKKAHALLQQKSQLIMEQNKQIRWHSKKLQEVNNRLKETTHFKEDLTQMIAHDMKNALSTVMNLAEGEPDRHKMESIYRSGQAANALVTNMLDIQRFEEAKMKLSKQPHRLTDLVNSALQQVEYVMQLNAVDVLHDISDRLFVVVDREIIIRVLVNLLTNAIKYSRTGDKIRLYTFHSEENNAVLNVAITDSGIGISAEDIPYVFEKYWQKNKGITNGLVSTGLGLTFCKLAVEAHGGEIRVASSQGVGTRFSFSLPEFTFSLAGDGNLAENCDFDIKKAIKDSGADLSNWEMELLQDSYPELRALKVYQVSHLTRIIRQIEQLDVNEKWKNKLKSAIYQSDEVTYKELLSFLER